MIPVSHPNDPAETQQSTTQNTRDELTRLIAPPPGAQDGDGYVLANTSTLANTQIHPNARLAIELAAFPGWSELQLYQAQPNISRTALLRTIVVGITRLA
jgi:hypothetical protein